MARVCFWYEIWCGDSCLKDHFPDLLDLESNKNALAAPSLGGMGDTRVRHWNSQFMRQVQDWKMELVENFFDL